MTLTPEQISACRTKLTEFPGQEDLGEACSEKILALSGWLNRQSIPVVTQEDVVTLNPVTIPNLIAEGLIAGEQLVAITQNPVTANAQSDALKRHKYAIDGLSEEMELLIISAQMYQIISDAEAIALFSRFNVDLVKSEDDASGGTPRTTTTVKETISSQNWGLTELGRKLDGSDMRQILVEINTASRTQLTDLPGLGTVSAEKLEGDRPYGSICEARDKFPELAWGQFRMLLYVNS